MVRVKVGAALSVVVVAIAAISCGPAGGEVMAAAGRATTDSGTSRLALTITTLGMSGGDDGRRVSAEGEFDYRRGDGRMVFNLGATGQAAPGELEVRVVSGSTFVRVPGEEMGGRPWLEIAAGSLGTGSPLPGLDRPINDPRSLLDALQGAGGDVDKVGEENVRGVETDRWRASVDLKEAEKQLDGRSAREFAALREEFGRPSIPFEVWIDDEDRVRRLTYSLEAHEETVRFELELYDFGAPVDVSAPPASEVTQFGKPDTPD